MFAFFLCISEPCAWEPRAFFAEVRTRTFDSLFADVRLMDAAICGELARRMLIFKAI